MSDRQYELVRAIEKEHWWFRGVRELLLGEIEHRLPHSDRDIRILDAGCGSGMLLSELEAGLCTGLDISHSVLCHARDRDRIAYVQGSIMDIPLQRDTFDIVISIDVLSNQGVADDRAALMELRRVLRPGGSLLLNLPAYDWLRSSHDDVAGTRHRYRAGELRRALEDAGFRDVHVSHRVSVLFPIAVLVRLLKRKGTSTDVRPTQGWLNLVLLSTLRLENRIVGRFRLPFGLSLFASATF